MTLWGIVSKLVNENAINDTVRTDRNFGNISLSASSAEGPTIESAQFTGQNLGGQISELCEAYKMGWRMKKVGAIYTVEMYQGIDRTTSQTHISLQFSATRTEACRASHIRKMMPSA